jgi:hypothetical protein
VAWPLPELEDGAVPELKPEFEFEPEFVEPAFVEPELDEPEFDEPELDEPELDEPDPEEADFEPELVEPEVDDEPEPADDEEEADLCVDPGRVSATMPATATLATVTVVVAERTLDRPRSRSAIARRTRSR